MRTKEEYDMKMAWQKEMDSMTTEQLQDKIEDIENEMELLKPEVMYLFQQELSDLDSCIVYDDEDAVIEYRKLRTRRKYAKKTLKKRG
jgi:uncharacterized FlaG/YvyC family protein